VQCTCTSCARKISTTQEPTAFIVVLLAAMPAANQVMPPGIGFGMVSNITNTNAQQQLHLQQQQQQQQFGLSQRPDSNLNTNANQLSHQNDLGAPGQIQRLQLQLQQQQLQQQAKLQQQLQYQQQQQQQALAMSNNGSNSFFSGGIEAVTPVSAAAAAVHTGNSSTTATPSSSSKKAASKKHGALNHASRANSNHSVNSNTNSVNSNSNMDSNTEAIPTFDSAEDLESAVLGFGPLGMLDGLEGLEGFSNNSSTNYKSGDAYGTSGNSAAMSSIVATAQAAKAAKLHLRGKDLHRATTSKQTAAKNTAAAATAVTNSSRKKGKHLSKKMQAAERSRCDSSASNDTTTATTANAGVDDDSNSEYLMSSGTVGNYTTNTATTTSSTHDDDSTVQQQPRSTQRQKRPLNSGTAGSRRSHSASDIGTDSNTNTYSTGVPSPLHDSNAETYTSDRKRARSGSKQTTSSSAVSAVSAYNASPTLPHDTAATSLACNRPLRNTRAIKRDYDDMCTTNESQATATAAAAAAQQQQQQQQQHHQQQQQQQLIHSEQKRALESMIMSHASLQQQQSQFAASQYSMHLQQQQQHYQQVPSMLPESRLDSAGSDLSGVLAPSYQNVSRKLASAQSNSSSSRQDRHQHEHSHSQQRTIRPVSFSSDCYVDPWSPHTVTASTDNAAAAAVKGESTDNSTQQQIQQQYGQASSKKRINCSRLHPSSITVDTTTSTHRKGLVCEITRIAVDSGQSLTDMNSDSTFQETVLRPSIAIVSGLLDVCNVRAELFSCERLKQEHGSKAIDVVYQLIDPFGQWSAGSQSFMKRQTIRHYIDYMAQVKKSLIRNSSNSSSGSMSKLQKGNSVTSTASSIGSALLNSKMAAKLEQQQDTMNNSSSSNITVKLEHGATEAIAVQNTTAIQNTTAAAIAVASVESARIAALVSCQVPVAWPHISLKDWQLVNYAFDATTAQCRIMRAAAAAAATTSDNDDVHDRQLQQTDVMHTDTDVPVTAMLRSDDHDSLVSMQDSSSGIASDTVIMNDANDLLSTDIGIDTTDTSSIISIPSVTQQDDNDDMSVDSKPTVVLQQLHSVDANSVADDSTIQTATQTATAVATPFTYDNRHYVMVCITHNDDTTTTDTVVSGGGPLERLSSVTASDYKLELQEESVGETSTTSTTTKNAAAAAVAEVTDAVNTTQQQEQQGQQQQLQQQHSGDTANTTATDDAAVSCYVTPILLYGPYDTIEAANAAADIMRSASYQTLLSTLPSNTDSLHIQHEQHAAVGANSSSSSCTVKRVVPSDIVEVASAGSNSDAKTVKSKRSTESSSNSNSNSNSKVRRPGRTANVNISSLSSTTEGWVRCGYNIDMSVMPIQSAEVLHKLPEWLRCGSSYDVLQLMRQRVLGVNTPQVR
jgi:hypothetical protein